MGDSVFCKVIEKNDWFKNVGIVQLVHDPTIFIVSEGYIKKIVAYPSVEISEEIGDKLGSIYSWSNMTGDSTINKLIVNGEFIYSAETAKKWLNLLEKWNKYKEENNVDYKKRKRMYTFELTDKFLTMEETSVFQDYLVYMGLDDGIWEVFSCYFKSGVKSTKPLLLKAFMEGQLYGVIILAKCKRYGKSLFDNKLLAGLVNFINIPCYLWIKFGCCMDMMSNPGFVKDPENSNEIFTVMLKYLRKNSILTIINDYSENKIFYESASILPALPHGLIDCSTMDSIDAYTMNYKNLKRKLRVFKNKHGAYENIARQCSEEQRSSLKKCFQSTAEKSVFHLPYQELYLNAALITSSTKIENVHYFIASIDNEIIGYQAALKTGEHLNALHGAFDRNRKTTYHAYDILFVKMTEFALEEGLKTIDFGAVINYTKKKMINRSIDLSYFIYSKYSIVQKAFDIFLRLTKIQGDKQMKFRNN